MICKIHYLFFSLDTFVRSFELYFESLSCCKRKICPIMRRSERPACLCNIEWCLSFCIMSLICTKSPYNSYKTLLYPYSTTIMVNGWHNAIFTHSFRRCSSDKHSSFTCKKPEIWTHQSIVAFSNRLNPNPCAVVPILVFSIYLLF